MSIFNDAEGTYIPTKQQVLIYTIAGKYYFSNKRNGTGLYLGSYLRQDVLVSHRDRRYIYFNLNNYSYISDVEDVRKKQTLRTAIGALGGYKCLIGKHLIVEAGIGIDLNLLRKFNAGDYIDWMGIPSIKAGYRF